jgi:hypothetical protein
MQPAERSVAPPIETPADGIFERADDRSRGTRIATGSVHPRVAIASRSIEQEFSE